MQSVSFTDIHIIQWLMSSDERIGKALFERVKTIPNTDQPLFHFTDMSNRQDVLKYLDHLLDLCSNDESIPLIHFVTHGNNYGIGTSLKPDQYLAYEELTDVLRKLNIQTKDNLFVVMSSCFGSKLLSIIKGTLLEHSPFWGILGPVDEINSNDILEGFTEFYTALYTSESIDLALKYMIIEVPSFMKLFKMTTSEDMFLKAFNQYVEKECAEERAFARARGILETLKTADRSVKIEAGLLDRISQYLRSRSYISKLFDERKRIFFMHDLYPGCTELSNPELFDS